MLPQNPPVTNKQAAEKNQAANAIHLQQQFKAGAAPQTTDTLSKLGAAFTGQQAQAANQAAAAQGAADVAGAEREQRIAGIEQQAQNIQDEEQLAQSIQDQKNELLAMDIGISEDEFADELMLQQMEQQNDFQNETQLMDLARLTFESDEEYQNALQMSQQKIDEQIADDRWELSVYDRMQNDKAWADKLAKDSKLKADIAAARRAAEERIKRRKEKAGKIKKAVAVAKIGVGATMMATGVGAGAGASLATQGVKEGAQAQGE
jgi:hypothetical protein